MECEKDENKQKEAGIGPFFLTTLWHCMQGPVFWFALYSVPWLEQWPVRQLLPMHSLFHVDFYDVLNKIYLPSAYFYFLLSGKIYFRAILNIIGFSQTTSSFLLLHQQLKKRFLPPIHPGAVWPNFHFSNLAKSLATFAGLILYLSICWTWVCKNNMLLGIFLLLLMVN